MKEDGANAGLGDLISSGFRGASALVRRRWSARPAVREAATSLAAARAKMYQYWSTIGVSEATMGGWAADALALGEYVVAAERCKKVWGPLSGKKIVDYGCGWGSFSVALSREGADITVLDHVPAHVEVARARVAGARGVVSDGCDLGANRAELAGRFDFAVLNSVIEHVGLNEGERGDARSSLQAKGALLREVASLLKPGGGLYLSTGNYTFPLDGEIKAWFFHWLPRDAQAVVLRSMGLSADRYGLLRWEELSGLAAEAGLRIEAVETVEVKAIEPLLVGLSFLSRRLGWSLSRQQIRRQLHLLAHDPRFMPAWFVFLRRQESAQSTAGN